MAFDFFTVPTLGFRALYFFFVIEHVPTTSSVLQLHGISDPRLDRTATRGCSAAACPYRYILFDRDVEFGNELIAFLRANRIKPDANEFAEPVAKTESLKWAARTVTQSIRRGTACASKPNRLPRPEACNIFVTETGKPKLLDFEIAKVLDPSYLNTASTRLLTPEYASPEQIRGDPITMATDIYSLGAVLYKLLRAGLVLRRFIAGSCCRISRTDLPAKSPI